MLDTPHSASHEASLGPLPRTEPPPLSSPVRLEVPKPDTEMQALVFADLSPDPERLLVYVDNRQNAASIRHDGSRGPIIGRYRTRTIGKSLLLSLEYDAWSWICRIDQDLIEKDEKGFALAYFTRDRRIVSPRRT